MVRTANKVLSACMALALALGLMPLPAFAADRTALAGGTVSGKNGLHVAETTAVSITTADLTEESTSVAFTISNLPQGAMAAVAQCGADVEPVFMDSSCDNIRIMNSYTGEPSEGENSVTFEAGTLVPGNKVVVFVTTGYSASSVVATSEPVVVSKAAVAIPSVSIASQLDTSATTIDVEHANVPVGAKLLIERYSSTTDIARYSGNIMFNSNSASWFSFDESGKNTVYFGGTLTLAAGDRVVAYILGSDWSELAASAPVTVKAAGSAEPEKPTRQQIVDACSVTMVSPHTDGPAAWKFSLADTSAQMTVNLHEVIEEATLTVYAYPKAASFDPDNAGVNKSVFSKKVDAGAAQELKDVTATFDLSGLDTTYNLIAYLYYHIPEEYTNDSLDYQYKTSQGFTIVDESGQTYENYTYPKASIAETELPTGATAMHVNLTGDERLFQLAADTADATELAARFQIHFMVVQYDASIERFDMGEDSYETLYDEYATEAFSGKEITLKQPLEKGKKVRALCYWSQYDGDKVAMPVPHGVDYDGKDDEAIVVTDDAAPIVASPKAVIADALTTATTSFSVNCSNLPEGALMLVQKFPAGAQVAYNADGSKNLKVFSPYSGAGPVNGSNAVAIEEALAAGEQVAAFVLAEGKVVAQSAVAVVAERAAGQVTVSPDPVMSETEAVTANIDFDVPEGSIALVKSFAKDAEIAYDKGNAHGVTPNIVKGDNMLTLANADSMTAGGVLVVFILNGGNPIAQSQPVAISKTAAVPTATIGLDGNDVELTQGDKFLSLTWSVDADADNVSWKLYQFEGDELDEETAGLVSQGTLVTSKYSHSGNTSIPLNAALKADARLQLVLTADGQKGFSNVMTVGATPAWAKVTPTVAFAQSAVRESDETVKLHVSYPEEYTSLGSEFFCNVSVYLYPGSYTDEEFEDKELDENTSIAHVVAGRNSANGETNGDIELTFGDTYKLTAGSRLIAKIRLPQAERQDHDSMWEDYLSWSIPVVSDDATVPGEEILLYNLGADTAKGEKMRSICESLGLKVVDLSDADLPRQVGALAGYDGYDENDSDYEGMSFNVEYMLMANLFEASLDRLLAAMKSAGVSIGAKSIVTETNKQWSLGRHITDIAEEHETITALVDLQKLVKAAEAVERAEGVSDDEWNAFEKAIEAAKKLYSTEDYEPTVEELRAAEGALEALYLPLANMVKLDGDVIIAYEKQSDGAYTLTASVKDATAEGLGYVYSWNDGAEGARITDVSADEVGARVVTVTAEGAYGKLSGQLAAPSTPEGIVMSVNLGTVSVSWNARKAELNRPAPSGYTVELFRGDELIATASTAKPSASFAVKKTGDYLVKVHADNVAGRSDKAIESITVEATSIRGATVTVANATYDKRSHKQVPTVKLGSKQLVSAVDFTYSYSDVNGKQVSAPTNAGTYTVKVVGAGLYSGTATQTFKINPAKSTITLKDKSTTYTGRAVASNKATVSGSQGTITYAYYSDTACKKSIAANKVVNAGAYFVKATVAAKGNYAKATSNVAKITVKQAVNPMKVTNAAGQTVKLGKAKTLAKAKTIGSAAKFTKKAQGTVSYAKMTKGSAKQLTVNAKTGKITVAKGTKAGTYKVKVKVTAKGTTNYAKLTSTITATVKVK